MAEAWTLAVDRSDIARTRRLERAGPRAGGR